MARSRGSIKLRASLSAETLDPDLAECLCRGVSVLGEPAVYGLRTKADWRRAWSQWGATLLRDHVEKRPGTRPVALYVLAEIELPARISTSLGVGPGEFVVVDDYGDPKAYLSSWHGCEAEHLLRLGVIDRQEMRRHLKSELHNQHCHRS